MIAFFSRHPRAASALVFVGTCLIIGVLAEVSFAILLERSPEWRSENPGLYTPDEVLGYRPRPGAKVEARQWRDGEAVYDVTYTIDANGRRIVPVDEAGRDRFLLLFGGSYTFGLGLHDDETLAYYTAKEAQEYMPYVYAAPGYGTAHMLLRLRAPDAFAGIEQGQGAAVYVFTDYHLYRLIGRSWVVTNFGRNFPKLELHDGEVVYAGPFRDADPVRVTFYDVLSRSAVFEYASRKLQFQLPVRVLTDANERLFVETVKASRSEIEASYPGTAFYVLFYPGQKYTERLKRLLEAEGIACLSFPDAFEGAADAYTLADGHPNAKATQHLGARLGDVLSGKETGED